MLSLILDLLRHIILSLMLNTSIKVIVTQYTDDNGWGQIREKSNYQYQLWSFVSQVPGVYIFRKTC